MAKLIGSFLLAFLLNVPLHDTLGQKTDTTTYYVTRTGTKYHYEHCHYLKYSKYSIKVGDSRFGLYQACKVCRPPNYSESTRSNKTIPVAQQRCVAITKAGHRCKRTAQSGSKTCWQH